MIDKEQHMRPVIISPHYILGVVIENLNLSGLRVVLGVVEAGRSTHSYALCVGLGWISVFLFPLNALMMSLQIMLSKKR